MSNKTLMNAVIRANSLNEGNVSLISNVSQKTLDIGNHFFQSFIYNLQRACRSNISLRQALLSNMLF